MNQTFWRLCLFISVFFSLCYLNLWSSYQSNDAIRLSQNEFLKSEYQSLLIESRSQRRLVAFNPVVDKGNSSWIHNKTIHGAVLQTCRFEKTFFGPHLRHSHHFQFCSTISESSSKQLLSSLPLPFVFWPTVIGRSCPFPIYHGTGSLHPSSLTGPSFRFVERGYGLSHMQIWLEFIFYDHDILDARRRTPPEYPTSTSWSSVSGTFQSFANGTLRKNDVVFAEEDLIMIVEEDSIPMMNLTNTNLLVLEKEMTAMTLRDVLFLKPCTVHSAHNLTTELHQQRRLQDVSTSPHPRNSNSHYASQHHNSHNNPAPHGNIGCFQAYVISRAIARRFAKGYDVCATKTSFEQQLLFMSQHHNLTLVHSQSQILKF